MLHKKVPLNIGIIGAGPGGLTLALCLSNHLDINITIFDADTDHRINPTYNASRSYTIDITGHGLKVINYLKLNEAFDKNFIKFKGYRFLKLNVDLPYNENGWTASRGDICKVLFEELLERNQKVKVFFNTKAKVLDINEGKLQYTDNDSNEIIEEYYDFIIAADGAGSEVRNLMEKLSYITVDSNDSKTYGRILKFDQNTNSLDHHYLNFFSYPYPYPAIAGAINGPLGHNMYYIKYYYSYLFV